MPCRSIRRATVIASLVAAALIAPFSAPVNAQPGDPIRPICFPVEGSVSYTDTFGAARSGGRTHEGQDLMGKRMQRLLAAVDAKVTSVKHDPAGNYVFLTDDEGWTYRYIHLNNDTPGTDDSANRFEEAFAPGLKPGMRVRAGEHIAYLGDSGNAESTSPHLHFEIRDPSGVPINGYESLKAATSCETKVASGTFAPFRTVEALIAQQYRDLLGREPDTGGLLHWMALLNDGVISPAVMAGQMLTSPEFGQLAAPVVRLYESYFDRSPDASGLTYWMDQRRLGVPLNQVSTAFAGSQEFTTLYGALTDSGFVELVYRNVLARTVDAGGLQHWVGQLGSGLSRGDAMVELSESAENIARTAADVRVTVAYLGLLGRAPEPDGLAYWRDKPVALVAGILGSAEYSARVTKLGTI